MSAFNTLTTQYKGDNCQSESEITLQYKYGDVWQHSYKIGDRISWEGNIYGRPIKGKVIVQAIAEEVPECLSTDEFVIIIGNDVIVEARENPGIFMFPEEDDFYPLNE